MSRVHHRRSTGTLRSQLELSSRLDGFRSRWRTLDECMYFNARRTCRPYSSSSCRHKPSQGRRPPNEAELDFVSTTFSFRVVFSVVFLLFLGTFYGRSTLKLTQHIPRLKLFYEKIHNASGTAKDAASAYREQVRGSRNPKCARAR